MRHLRIPALLCLFLGCLPSPVVDASLCAAEPAGGSASTARLTAPAASDSSVRLTESFPNWTPECAACIRAECGSFVERCAGDANCVSFAACRFKENDPSPGSELRCGREFGQSIQEPQAAIRELNNCWQTSCVEPCSLGTLWDCAGAYSLPAPDSSPVRLTQFIQRLLNNDPVVGASVRFCGLTTPPGECERLYDAQAVSDDAGAARAEVPIATDYRVGWSGYRQVVKPDSYDVRLQTNVSMPLDRFMLQHVPTIAETQVLSRLYGADLQRGNVVFQVFDCAHTGAEGVDIEVAAEVPGTEISDGSTSVRYQRGTAPSLVLEPGGTRAESDGGGAIVNLTPGEWISVNAVRRCTGDIVAQTRIFTRPGELLLLELHPNPAGG